MMKNETKFGMEVEGYEVGDVNNSNVDFAYFITQTVSVSVSVLTLTFISVERWYAICFPLKFKATTSRAKRAIFAIWVISLLFGK